MANLDTCSFGAGCYVKGHVGASHFQVLSDRRNQASHCSIILQCAA